MFTCGKWGKDVDNSTICVDELLVKDFPSPLFTLFLRSSNYVSNNIEALADVMAATASTGIP